MRSGARGVVAVLLRDNAKALKVLEALRRLGIQALWVTAPEEIPLTVKVAVATREEGLSLPSRLKTLYLEDHHSPECLALQAASSLGPNRPPTTLDVAIDPGRRLGAAYVVDGYVVKTHTYPSIEAFEEDCRMAVECLGKGRRLTFYVGYRPETLTHELVAKLKKHYPAATILILPDDGAGPEFKDLSPDEESALKIYFKATSENI